MSSNPQGLLQQQPGEPRGLFYPQLWKGRMGVVVGWSMALPSARDQPQLSHSFNDCPNICPQRVPVLMSQLFRGEEARFPPVPKPQLLTEAMLPQRVLQQHGQVFPWLQPLPLLTPQGLSQVLPKQVPFFRKEVRPLNSCLCDPGQCLTLAARQAPCRGGVRVQGYLVHPTWLGVNWPHRAELEP